MALKARVVSAAVMIPPVLAAVWLGGWVFAALAALASALIAWEWIRMSNLGVFSPLGQFLALDLAVACLLVMINPQAALVMVLVLAVVAYLISKRAWTAWGVIYAGIPSLALIWLRGDSDFGRDLVITLLITVWAIDTSAYLFGRVIGGPLLLPRISPKKTWAGLVGGMVGASLIGALAVPHFGGWTLKLVLPLCVVLAVIEQGGDFLESWVKRRWGVKDSSALIPGHGGVMDRVDGLLAAGLVVALGKIIMDWM